VACHLDLADPDSVDRFAKEAEAAFGPVEILVSNAARIQPGTALETSPEDFEESCASTSAGRTAWCVPSAPPWWRAAGATWSS